MIGIGSGSWKEISKPDGLRVSSLSSLSVGSQSPSRIQRPRLFGSRPFSCVCLGGSALLISTVVLLERGFENGREFSTRIGT